MDQGLDPLSRSLLTRSLFLLSQASSPPVLLATGTIADELVLEEDGQWRFSLRKFAMDPPAPPPPAPPA